MEARPPGSDDLGVGLAPRLAAGLADLVVILAAWWVALFALVLVLASLGRLDGGLAGDGDPLVVASTPEGFAMGLIAGGVLYAISGFYLAYAWVRLGATPGQQLAKLAVMRVDTGTRLSPGQAAVRWFVMTMPPLGLPFGVLLVAWLAVVATTIVRNPRRRGIHDLAAGSIVVRRPRTAGRRQEGGPAGAEDGPGDGTADSDGDGTPRRP